MTEQGWRAGGLVETDYGATFVRMIGHGPHLFVLHGGPGFDHAYLFSSLAFLAEKRTLVFYDQPGCGRTPAPDRPLTLEFVAKHFRSLCIQIAPGKRVEYITHSWGALVLAAALSSGFSDDLPMPEFARGVLVNPAPVTFPDYLASYERFVNRLPPAVAEEVFRLAAIDQTGGDLVDLLLPYYGLADTVNPEGILQLNHRTYREITQAMTAFDFTGSIAGFGDYLIVCGEQDIFGVSLVEPLLNGAGKYVNLGSSAHFPFFETPREFSATLAEFFA